MKVYPRYRVRPPCGTKPGYDYHRRVAIEDACVPCSEAMRKYWIDYRAANVEKIKALRENQFSRTRNNRKRAAYFGGEVTTYTVRDVINTYGTDCHICLGPINMEANRGVGKEGWEMSLHVDHVHPLSKGGADSIENVRPSHGKCNIIKGATVLDIPPPF